MKTLILYYSYGGNTRRIAEMIQKQVSGDLVEIETEKSYPTDYNAVVEQGLYAKVETVVGGYRFL